MPRKFYVTLLTTNINRIVTAELGTIITIKAQRQRNRRKRKARARKTKGA